MNGSYLCEVSITNREIAAVYKSEILSHLLQIGAITRTTANKIAESLYANDYKRLQKAIAEYMDKSISFYDAEMNEDAIQKILKIGIAFSGKKVVTRGVS